MSDSGECFYSKGVDPGTIVAMNKDDTHYKMDHKNRGIALIFNHIKYEGSTEKERKGTEADCQSITETMQSFGFNVVVCTDFTKEEILKELKDTVELDHTHNDCLAIFVLTHGNQNHLFAFDDKYDRTELWRPFNGIACSSLAGKPKLIFIQACRVAGDKGATRSGRDSSSHQGTEEYESIPMTSDFLIYNSCADGFASFRDNKKGSWFIQTLCTVLNRMGCQDDLVSLFTVVNKEVGVGYKTQEGDAFEKQMPVYKSKLMFKIQFTKCEKSGTVTHKP